jgi:hypothetical protein
MDTSTGDAIPQERAHMVLRLKGNFLATRLIVSRCSWAVFSSREIGGGKLITLGVTWTPRLSSSTRPGLQASDKFGDLDFEDVLETGSSLMGERGGVTSDCDSEKHSSSADLNSQDAEEEEEEEGE